MGRQTGLVAVAAAVVVRAIRDSRSSNGHRTAALEWLQEPETIEWLQALGDELGYQGTGDELVARVMRLGEQGQG